MHPRAKEFKEQAEEIYDISVSIEEFPEGTKTAADAAAAIGCEIAQIVKSIVMNADGEIVVVLTSGANRVSETKLADELSVPEETIRSADPGEVREVIGWSIGGVPPLCHETSVPLLLDAALTGYETIWAAAGTPEAVFETSPAELRTCADPAIVDVFDE